MSFLPPVVLEIRAQAAQFYAETAKVADSVRAMSAESGAAAAGMSDKVSADAASMGERVAASTEAMAAKASLEAESMARRVVTESEQMDVGATAATEDMVRKVIAGFEAMSVQSAAAIERQSLATTAAMDSQAAKVVAAEEKTTAAVRSSSTAIVEALGTQNIAAEKSAATATATGLRTEESFIKTAATAVASTGRMSSAFVTSALKQAEAAKGAEASIMGVANGIAKVAAVSGLVIAGVGLDMAAHFQKATTLLVTAGGESESQLGNIRTGILGISADTGTSAAQLAEGMYVMEKAGYRGAAGLAALQASAEGAKAENVDLGIMTQATTDILLDYHYKMGTAADATQSSVSVVNQLVAASGAAKVTMQDFAASMAAVIPIASNANISFAEVGGAIATMTQHGQTAQQSSQNLANLIQALIRPNNMASAAMQQMGIDTVGLAVHLGDTGLSGALKKVSQAVLDHMGPDGTIVQDTMKKSATATAGLKDEMGKMPPELAKLSQGLLDGTETQKSYRKAALDTGGSAGAVADNFLSLYKASQGVNDSIKNGQPSMMTYQAAMTKMLGNVTAARAATMLLMNNSDDLNRSIALVAEAADKGGNHISTWEETQKQLSTQLDIAKQRSEALAIEIGTALIPMASAALSGMQDLYNGFKDGNPVLMGVATLLAGVVTVAVTNYTAGVIEAGIASLNTFIDMGAGAIGMAGQFISGFMASEVAVGQFASTAEVAGAAASAALLPVLGLVAGAAIVTGGAMLGLAAAQKAWGTNDTAPKLGQIKEALVSLSKTADNAKNSQMDDLFKNFDSGALKAAPKNVNDLDSAIKAVTHEGIDETMNKVGDAISNAFGQGNTSAISQVEDRIKGVGQSLGDMVKGGQADTAAKDFDKLAQSFQKQGKSAQDALDSMPAYKQSLVDLAGETNQNLAPAELLSLAMGKVPAKMQSAATANQTYVNAAGDTRVLNKDVAKTLDDMGVSIDGQITNLGKLYDAMVKTGLANLSARDAEFRFGDAVQKATASSDDLKKKLNGDLSSALDGTGNDFNKTTDAGQKAETSFSGVATAGLQAASVLAHDVTKGAGDVSASLQVTYDKMITTATGFGMGKEKAEALTRGILNIPPGVDVKTWLDQTAAQQVDTVKQKLDAQDGRQVNVSIRINPVGEQRFIDAALGIPLPPASIAIAGPPGGATGGAVAHLLGRAMGGTVDNIPGLAGGGPIPGTPPKDLRKDNILALVNGKPLKVQSGEYIVNGEQTKKNMPWLKAINGGANMNDLFTSHTPALNYARSPEMAHTQNNTNVTNHNSKSFSNSVVINSTADAKSLAAEFSRITANMS